MRQVVRVADKVVRTCSPGGIGPVYQGSRTHFQNTRPISYLGCATYAGDICRAHPRVHVNALGMAMHPGKCTCGYTLTGSPTVFLG